VRLRGGRRGAGRARSQSYILAVSGKSSNTIDSPLPSAPSQ